MNRHEAMYLARQRQRWLRPDAARFLRPDWRSRKYWAKPPVETGADGGDGGAWAGKSADAAPVAEGGPRLDEVRRAHASLAHLRWLVADLKFDLVMRDLARKANFDPNQPRVPRGDPDGGQWTDAGGGGSGTKPTSTRRINDPRVLSDVTPDNTWKPGAQYAQNDTSRPGRDRAEGHHYVPRSLYEKLPLSEETRKVFDESKTGRLYDERSNRYDTAHRHYNDAVKEHFERFIDRNKTQPEQMTPDQARSFLKEVMESRDPRIRQFNMRIQLREIMRRVFRGARGLD